MRFCLALVATMALLVANANAEFTVWVSNKAPGENPVAGPLDFDLAANNSSGTLYVYGDGDTTIGGFSLDLSLTGNAIKFTGPATINTPAGRWSFPGNPTVTDNLVDNFEAVAIPPGPTGVGGAVADEIPGIGFLLGSFGYMGLGNNDSSSALTLTVSENLFADLATGGDVSVRLGGPNVSECSGSVTTCSGAGGTIQFGEIVGGLPVVTDFTDTADLNETIQHIVQVTNGPVTWSGLQNPTFTPAFPGGVGAPNAPQWDPITGTFTFNTTGADRGLYTWEVTATNTAGSDTGLISITVPFVPEPSTLALFGLAMVGMGGMARRRS